MRRWVGIALATVGLAVAGILVMGRSRGGVPVSRESLPPPVVMTDTLQTGESLSELFSRHGIVAEALSGIVTALALDPTRVPSGWVAHFAHHGAGPVASRVTIRPRVEEELSAVRDGDGWRVERAPIAWTSRAVRVEGRVTTSVHDAMLEATSEVSFTPAERIRIAWDVADVFAWQVDFSREMQPGDEIAALIEWHTSERGETRVGAVLASRLEVGRRQYVGYRFSLPDGRSQYFDAGGVSLRRAFLRAPVEFRRIASRFSNARFHPILRVNRPHQGVDYAASTGTPVQAAGDGIVLSASWSGNYGRMVELRHRNGITTRYAHLSRFGPGLRPSARVSQGDVIGYVGSSGLATAPHLHYEFRIGATARDPSRVDLGEGTPLPSDLKSPFIAARDRLQRLLDGSSPRVAAAGAGR